MRRRQDYFTRLIRSEGVVLRVRLRPLGSEMRDLTRGVVVVHWFSILPGLISILGWILHHTRFRHGWIVTVEPETPGGAGPHHRLGPEPKHEADRTFLALVDWLRAGNALDGFAERRTT